MKGLNLKDLQAYLENIPDTYASDSISAEQVYYTFMTDGRVDGKIQQLRERGEIEAARMVEEWKNERILELAEKFELGRKLCGNRPDPEASMQALADLLTKMQSPKPSIWQKISTLLKFP